MRIYFIYQANYGMKISSAAEETERKNNFAKVHAAIEQHNANPDATYEMGHNEFSGYVRVL